jgi:primosomal protein N' (replication factor Y)
MHYYNIAVPIPSFDYFTYSSEQNLSPGTVVEVNMRRKKSLGVVIEESSKPSDFDVKPINSTIENLRIPKAHLDWLLWLSDYYLYPPGLVIQSSFPPLKEKVKESNSEPHIEKRFDLTDSQKTALSQIMPLNGFKAHLLHGVTGSGKTEIYLELFEEVLKKQKKQGLFLLPEISLTPQLERRFKERFGSSVSTYHSQLTPRQKTNAWYDFKNGRTQILIGARSALFCPTENLGLIVVDEEHESSFKQEEKFLYNAKDSALKLAQLKNIPIILGSATPSLESMMNVKKNKIHYTRIKEKVFKQKTPERFVVDMTQVEPRPEPLWLSPLLKEKIEHHLAHKKQVALFLNRRGWSSFVQCFACGHEFKCVNCDISLTLHQKTQLFCHYCSYGEPLPEQCPECGEEQIKKFGLGTEQVVRDCEQLFPQARILKFDRDEVHNKHQLKEAIEKIDNYEVDLIVGTQMISKGLDFERLSLMGVLDSDQSFSFPDFRATEKSVQQLNQVLGRVGRREHQEAEVVIQTRHPEHIALNHLDETSYENFSDSILKKRELYNYPPFVRMVSLLVKAHNETQGDKLIKKVSDIFEGLKKKWPSFSEVQILGPTPSPIQKIRNEYRFQLILKFPLTLPHQSFVKEGLRALGKLPAKTKLSINVDPVDLM